MTWTDAATGRAGYLVIDRLVRGLAGGGTRMRAGCTLEEVSRLAAAMSLKNGALGIPAGGAKCGIDCDPHDAEAVPLLRRFVRAMHPLWDAYVATGEDMGVQQSTLNVIFEELGLASSMRAALRAADGGASALARMREAFSTAHRGTPLVDLVGGYGVAAATEAALAGLDRPLVGTRIALQGFGSMGGSAARYLAARGACIVGVADAQGLIASPDGLDVGRLLAARNEFGEIDRDALRPGDRQLPREEWLGLDCDVLVPAAVADAIDDVNADRVLAALVVEAANLPTTPAAEARLLSRGVTVVPDFVANSATNGWAWWLALGQIGPGPHDAFKRIDAVIPAIVEEMLDRAVASGMSPRAAARQVACERLDRMAAEHGVEGPLRLGPL